MPDLPAGPVDETWVQELLRGAFGVVAIWLLKSSLSPFTICVLLLCLLFRRQLEAFVLSLSEWATMKYKDLELTRRERERDLSRNENSDWESEIERADRLLGDAPDVPTSDTVSQ